MKHLLFSLILLQTIGCGKQSDDQVSAAKKRISKEDNTQITAPIKDNKPTCDNQNVGLVVYDPAQDELYFCNGVEYVIIEESTNTSSDSSTSSEASSSTGGDTTSSTSDASSSSEASSSTGGDTTSSTSDSSTSSEASSSTGGDTTSSTSDSSTSSEASSSTGGDIHFNELNVDLVVFNPQNQSLCVEITNLGTTQVNNIKVEFNLLGLENNLKTIGGIQVNEKQSTCINIAKYLNSKKNPINTFDVEIQLDPNNNFIELDEANNYLLKQIIINN